MVLSRQSTDLALLRIFLNILPPRILDSLLADDLPDGECGAVKDGNTLDLAIVEEEEREDLR